MKLRGCSTSHFVWTIQDGMMKKVHNTDSHGKPAPMFKSLEDIYQSKDAKYTSDFQDDYAGTEIDGSGVEIDHPPLPFAVRKTLATNCYAVEEDKPECPYENEFEELTLSQLKSKCKRKKRKASESVLLTPKVEEEDSDLGEPLCKFRVKVSKSSKSKTVPANGSLSTSFRSTPIVTHELSAGADGALLFSKDRATVTVKVEAPEVENFECREVTLLADDHLHFNEPVNFVASESGFIVESMNSGSSTNEGEIGLNEVSLDMLSETENTFLVTPMGEENMELVNEGNITNDGLPLSVSEVDKEERVDHNQPPLNASFLEDDSSVEDMMASTSDSQSHPYVHQSPEKVKHIPGAQVSDLTFNDDYPCVDLGQVSDSCMVEEFAESSPTNQEYGSPNMMSDYLCLPWKTHSWPSTGEVDDHAVSAEANSPISEEKQLSTSVNVDADSIPLNSDNNSVVSEDIPIHQEQPSFVPANADTEVMFSSHNNQIDTKREASEVRNSHCIELRHPERLPSTRKAISPTSQEKLCLAMKSAEVLDDMDHYKCKEKLYFEEEAENKFSSTSSDLEDNETNVNPQQATQLIQNKVVISPKHLRRPKNYKKGYPPKKGDAPKGCLDGPRLCRSLPRLSTGCTSIQGCSESAIAFSQRQMQDIESLASKLMNELNSMKSIVGEKMLHEAHSSTSLKNEADEVKSAIKSATKTEETARKWLSMMARDCSRFCKIMKLKEDNNTSTSDPALGSTNQEKPPSKERKKISFADEAGGALCDIKVFQIDGASLEPL